MCGIAGFISFNQSFSENHLHQMTDSLQHRGPDADGFFYDGICGLGHRRLSILDLSEAANQPMYSQNSRFVCVYNGEIYNFKEIKNWLANQGINCKTTSDTEVLLEWFVLKGTDFVKDLNGIFSIAIYDTQTRTTFLFRDRIGIKPLYFYRKEEDFAFASELKALALLNNLPFTLNYQAIAQFLHLGYIPAPNTIYQSVEKLPAGCWALFTEKKFEIHTYWSPESNIGADSLKNETEAIKELDNLLRSAVEMQMIADVPLGVFLSGGIDSSTVAAFASQFTSGQKLKTFSIGFEEEKFNEAPFARSVADYLQTDHHELTVSTRQAQELVTKLPGIFDEPFADSSAIPTLLVSQLARKSVTVTLSGDGGDELFFGYGTYDWAKRLKNPFLSFFDKEIAGLLGLSKKDSFRKGKNMFTPTETHLESHVFSQEQGFFSWEEVEAIVIPVENSKKQQNYHINDIIGKTERNLTAAENQALFDLHYYLPDDLLVKVDRASMFHGLETRVPLLDHRIIEWALNLSPELKSQRGIRKYLLKKVLYQYIPEKLFDRPKRGFAVPLAKWLQTDLKFLTEEYLNEKVVKESGIVKWEKVKMLKEQFLKGDMFIYNKIWLLIVLHQFLANYKTKNTLHAETSHL
jgi:asparagine synthase (glutamine-hydrolysing)